MSSSQFHPVRQVVSESSAEEGWLRAPRDRGEPSEGLPRGVSRRHFIGTATGAAGALFGAGVWAPARADDENRANVAPIPIPITTTPFHFNFPGPPDQGHEPSTITDFNGFIGAVNGFVDGTGTNTLTGQTSAYKFHFDLRFMKGVYIAMDGRTRQGAFAFI